MSPSGFDDISVNPIEEFFETGIDAERLSSNSFGSLVGAAGTVWQLGKNGIKALKEAKGGITKAFKDGKGAVAKLLKGRLGKGSTDGAKAFAETGKAVSKAEKTVSNGIEPLIDGVGVSGKNMLTAVSRATGTTLAKDAVKTAEKEVSKTGTKILGKKVPLIGLAVGGYFAYDRFTKGDYKGASGEVASGLASCIPGVGTAVSLGIDSILFGRDAASSLVTKLGGDPNKTVQFGPFHSMTQNMIGVGLELEPIANFLDQRLLGWLSKTTGQKTTNLPSSSATPTAAHQAIPSGTPQKTDKAESIVLPDLKSQPKTSTPVISTSSVPTKSVVSTTAQPTVTPAPETQRSQLTPIVVTPAPTRSATPQVPNITTQTSTPQPVVLPSLRSGETGMQREPSKRTTSNLAAYLPKRSIPGFNFGSAQRSEARTPSLTIGTDLNTAPLSDSFRAALKSKEADQTSGLGREEIG